MDLKKYLAEIGAREEALLASACKVTKGHLRNIASGFRAASPSLAAALESASCGFVTRQDLRPNDWQLIWPELAPKQKEAA